MDVSKRFQLEGDVRETEKITESEDDWDNDWDNDLDIGLDVDLVGNLVVELGSVLEELGPLQMDQYL